MSEIISVRDNPDEGRFEVHVDGVLAGFTEYTEATVDGVLVRTFPHTEVDPEFGGRGLSKILIGQALDASRAAKAMVKPVCPAVAGFIEKNPAYADLVA